MKGDQTELPEELNAISERIIGAAIEVHRALGPGLLERLYEDALVYELGLCGLGVERQVPVRMRYKELELVGQRLDLVVAGTVVLELKATDTVADVHKAQLLGYMRAGRYPLGLLINFNVPLLHNGIHRRVLSEVLAVPSVHPTSIFAPSAGPLRSLRTPV
jgi:GxxExxY protein